MRVAVLTVQLYLPWVHSLKEKRAIIKGMLSKLHSKFNVSAAETARQDDHAFAVLSVAAIAANPAQADGIMQKLLSYIEGNTEAEVAVLERELL